MTFTKTLGLFFLNKILEFYHHVLKDLLLICGALILGVAIAIAVLVAVSGFGLIVIQLLYATGFSVLAESCFIGPYVPDAPTHFRGSILGLGIIGVSCIWWWGYTYRQQALDFFKSNWELAKSGKIYKPRKYK